MLPLRAREASLRQREANNKLSLQNRPSDFGPALGSLRLNQGAIAKCIASRIWLYLRFALSFRDVEDLLAERGIAALHHVAS